MPDPSTTRLALYKSKSDGSELVNYTTDIGQNLDKIDTAVGFQIVTSTTRPSSPYPGKPIAESDTAYRSYFCNGTSPASASWVEIPNSSGIYGGNLNIALGKQLNIGGSGSTAAYACRFSDATGDYIISGRVVSDSASRLTLRADGQLGWGPGTAGTDTFLARSGTAALSLTGALTASGNLSAANFSLVADWTTPTLATGYAGDGNSNGTPQYRVINLLGTQFVQWRGGVAITYSGNALQNSGNFLNSTATVPAAYRPASTRTVAAACSASSSSQLNLKIDFKTDGTTSIVGTTTNTTDTYSTQIIRPPWVSLNGIMYSL